MTRPLTQKQLAALEYVRTHSGASTQELADQRLSGVLYTLFTHRLLSREKWSVYHWFLTQAGVDALRERKAAQ